MTIPRRDLDESVILDRFLYFGCSVILLIFLLLIMPGAVTGATSTRISYVSSTTGDLSVTGTVWKMTNFFALDHPLDPANKILFHAAIESPEAKNMYDGVVTLDGNGEAVIELPWYFEELNKDYRYLATPIGAPAPNLYLKKAQKKNKFIISGGDSGLRVSWQITGVRKDPFILANPIVPETEKGSDTIVNKGEYRYPEAYEDDD